MPWACWVNWTSLRAAPAGAKHRATAIALAEKRTLDKRLTQAPRGLRRTDGEAQHRAGGGRPALHRRRATRDSPRHRLSVRHLPGLTTRRITVLNPGEAMTSACDDIVIADAPASWLTAALGRLEEGAIVELEMIVGLDDDLADEAHPHQQSTPRPADSGPPPPGTCPRLAHPPVVPTTL